MKLLETIVMKLSTAVGLNLLSVAYKGIGISADYEALTHGFFENTLTKILDKGAPVTCLDVGSNVGEVTKLLLRTFPKSTVHSFEPNPFTYLALQKNVVDDRAKLNNIGLGDSDKEASLFFYTNEKTTGHASIHRDVFSLHDSADIQEHRVMLSTVDLYCRSNGITRIDFMKVDTEGNELAVLQGARALLKAGGVSVIQFEFNEMNVVSRVFLRDFYELLPDFSFYRIKEERLFPLGKYSPANEIFRIQNILAVHNKFKVA
jgi:FkbM family methyltransferase